jgi:hypothetical protein
MFWRGWFNVCVCLCCCVSAHDCTVMWYVDGFIIIPHSVTCQSVVSSKQISHRMWSGALPSFSSILFFPLSYSSCLCLLHPPVTVLLFYFRCHFTIQLTFLLSILTGIFLSLTVCNATSFLTQSVQLIIYVLLRHQISKLSRYSWSFAVSTFQLHTKLYIRCST